MAGRRSTNSCPGVSKLARSDQSTVPTAVATGYPHISTEEDLNLGRVVGCTVRGYRTDLQEGRVSCLERPYKIPRLP